MKGGYSIEIKNLFFSYTNNRNIFENLSFKIVMPGMYFILGETGCGKSTLLNLLSNYLTPDRGEINFRDNEKVVCFFQDYKLLDFLTVHQNLELVLDINGEIDNKENKINSLLGKYEILELKDKYITEISGGEKARVALIRMLLMDANIYLVDEATGELDTENGLKLIKYLKDLSKDRIIIFVTHNRNYAYKFGDQIYQLKDRNLILIKDRFKKKNDKLISKTHDNGVMKTKSAFSFVKNFMKKEKSRILLSSFFMAFSMIFMVISMLGLFGFSNLEGNIFNSFITNNIAYVSRIDEITSSSSLTLNKKNNLTIYDKNTIKRQFNDVEFYPSLGYFLPSTYSINLEEEILKIGFYPYFDVNDDNLVYGNKELEKVIDGKEFTFTYKVDKKFEDKEKNNYVFSFEQDLGVNKFIDDFSFLNTPVVYYNYFVFKDLVFNTQLDNGESSINLQTVFSDEYYENSEYLNYETIVYSQNNILEIKNNIPERFTLTSHELEVTKSFKTIITNVSLIVLLFTIIVIFNCFLFIYFVLSNFYHRNKSCFAILLSFNAEKKSYKNIFNSIVLYISTITSAIFGAFLAIVLPFLFISVSSLMRFLKFNLLMIVPIILISVLLIVLINKLVEHKCTKSILREDLLLSLRMVS